MGKSSLNGEMLTIKDARSFPAWYLATLCRASALGEISYVTLDESRCATETPRVRTTLSYSNRISAPAHHYLLLLFRLACYT